MFLSVVDGVHDQLEQVKPKYSDPIIIYLDVAVVEFFYISVRLVSVKLERLEVCEGFREDLLALDTVLIEDFAVDPPVGPRHVQGNLDVHSPCSGAK